MHTHVYQSLLNADLTRRNLDVDERRYLVGRGVVTEIQSNMGEYRVHSHICVTVAFQYASTCIKSIIYIYRHVHSSDTFIRSLLFTKLEN